MKVKFSELPVKEKFDRIGEAYDILFEGVDDSNAEYVVSNILSMIFDSGEDLDWCWNQIFMFRTEQRQAELDRERAENNEEV